MPTYQILFPKPLLASAQANNILDIALSHTVLASLWQRVLDISV